MNVDINVIRGLLVNHCQALLIEGNYPIDFAGYLALVDIIKDLILVANGYTEYVDYVHGDDLHDLACKIANIMLGKE